MKQNLKTIEMTSVYKTNSDQKLKRASTEKSRLQITNKSNLGSGVIESELVLRSTEVMPVFFDLFHSMEKGAGPPSRRLTRQRPSSPPSLLVVWDMVAKVCCEYVPCFCARG